jgi:hypothetical protein
VLDKAQQAVQVPLLDPAGYGGNLGEYLHTQTTTNDIVARLQTACERAREAERYEAQGRTDLAFEKWRMIFGDCFPTFG